MLACNNAKRSEHMQNVLHYQDWLETHSVRPHHKATWTKTGTEEHVSPVAQISSPVVHVDDSYSKYCVLFCRYSCQQGIRSKIQLKCPKYSIKVELHVWQNKLSSKVHLLAFISRFISFHSSGIAQEVFSTQQMFSTSCADK